MAWHASGDDRIKSYKVYKELEAKAAELQERLERAEVLLRVKDATIRQLAAELAQALPAVPAPIPADLVQPTESGTVPKVDSEPPPSMTQQRSKETTRPGPAKANPGQSLKDRLSTGTKG